MTNHNNDDGAIEHLAALRSQRRSLLGIDLGAKTIGLATSDPDWLIATPLETLRRGRFKEDAASLGAICESHDIGALVLGLPLNMDGSEGPRVQSTRAFARNLTPVVRLPLAFWDERLSTRAVTRTLLAADTSREKRKKVIDKLAAAYILQGALDRLSLLS